MKRNAAIVVIVLSLVLIVGIVAVSSLWMPSNPSPDAQRVRMYLVFAGYIALLLAIRSLTKANRQTVAATGCARGVKVAIGSIATSGAFFLCGVVLSVVIGGSGAVETVMPKLLYLVPAIAIISAPWISKRMS